MAAALTDGLAVLGEHRHDDQLTDSACWRVEFEHYAFHPTLTVPFETGLEMVEALGRRKLLEELTQHGPYTAESKADPDAWYAEISTRVAGLRVLRVKRLADVTLDPRFG